MTLIERLIKYQRERFPLRILVFTTISSVLVSVAVTGNAAGLKEIALLFFASLFMVFHIRAIDESRDAAYDTRYYPERPVQQGLVTIRELFIVDAIGLAFTALVGFYYGFPSLVWLSALYVFTLLAWKDFFMRKFFHNRPLVYHIVNSPQMLFLQLFIYAVLTGSFQLTKAMWLQLILVYINIFILEVIRKIKLKNDNVGAGDIYSKSMGYTMALLFTLLLVLGAYYTFWELLKLIAVNVQFFFDIGSGIVAFSVITLLLHLRLKSKATEKLMLLSGFLVYVGLNILLYLSVL